MRLCWLVFFVIAMLSVLPSCGEEKTQTPQAPEASNLSLAEAAVASATVQTSLDDKWREELAMEPHPDESVPKIKLLTQKLGQLHVVFVTGFFNEAFSDYFEDNLETMRDDLGIDTLTVVRPPSWEGLHANAAWLHEVLLNKYAEGGSKPLVIVSHSKGAAEIALMLMEHPEFARKALAKAALIQAAMGGSHIADLLGIGGPLANLFLERTWPGLASLRTKDSRRIFGEATSRLSEHDRLAISEKVSFVRSYQKSGTVTEGLKATHAYLSDHFGPNDGLLLPEDQILPGLGRDLGALDADHSDLVFSESWSDASRHTRHAFTRALLRQILE